MDSRFPKWAIAVLCAAGMIVMKWLLPLYMAGFNVR